MSGEPAGAPGHRPEPDPTKAKDQLGSSGSPAPVRTIAGSAAGRNFPSYLV
jgi:hypothetical protein